ncbi:pyruvate ferredoxin oxidoreductase [Microbacterium lushaniae]|uniref:Pyruvate ferredoxin oxidoreductase n=1 Tax=Microbacterium lushaniae TaxID=2614639 RepID=A0A5J6L582_9MICO|nr:pyruvate ferredoxin oxidoreductase [Microbacterium lushaniae]QEW03718.1 pyruvate ferredoxin oxidoreductase [Microbacterium lushaniae]
MPPPPSGSRATAWRIAAQNDWADTALAVASLQADALITADPALAAAAAGIVRVADIGELITPDGTSV